MSTSILAGSSHSPFESMPNEVKSRILSYVAIAHSRNAQGHPREFTLVRLTYKRGVFFRAFLVNKLFLAGLRQHFFGSNVFSFIIIRSGPTYFPTPASSTSTNYGQMVLHPCNPTNGISGAMNLILPHPAVAAGMRHVILTFPPFDTQDVAFSDGPDKTARPHLYRTDVLRGTELNPCWFDVVHALQTHGFTRLRSLTLRLTCNLPSAAVDDGDWQARSIPAEDIGALGDWVEEVLRGMTVRVEQLVARLEVGGDGIRSVFYEIRG